MTDDRVRDRLEVFPVAIGRYREHAPLEVEVEVARVVDLFHDFGGHPVPWEVPMAERDGDAVAARLDRWSGAPARFTVLYWVGHGWSDGLHASLAHAASPKAVQSFGVVPANLADHIGIREGSAPDDGWAIVVIDACRSARFVELLNAEVDNKRGPRRVLLVGVSGEGSTMLGRFGVALTNLLRDTFRADPEIELWSLARELDRNLPGSQVLARKIGESVLRRVIPPVAAATPLDVRAEIESVLAELTEDERRHFIPKAQGAELGELSWYFEGRHTETSRIADWMHDTQGGLLVVTGRAGSGKSALLGHLVVQSRPALRDALVRHGLAAELLRGDQPSDIVFDTVLHLTGLTASEVTRRLAADLGLPALEPEAGIAEQVGALSSALGEGTHTILVDALDEAVAPLTVARMVLRPLAAVPRVRVVVGTRRSTREGPDEPEPADHDLLEALGATDAATMAVERDPAAIASYVRRRLATVISRGMLSAADAEVQAAGAAIGESGQEFLFARLAVYEILARPALLSGEGLAELAADDHRRLFARAVGRLTAQRSANGPLLAALAFARGRGVPMRDGVWAGIAEALHVGTEITDAEIGELLEMAAPYVMLDREHNQSVYRLAHRTFAEHFTRELDGPELVSPEDRRRHLDIVCGIVRAAANTAADANPYVSVYLSAHVAAAGPEGWRQLADHPGVLDELDPQAVGADAMRSAFGRFALPSEIAGVIGARHLLSHAARADRPGIRQLGMARHAGTHRGATDGDGGTDAEWALLWANIEPQPLHITMLGHTGPVRAMAVLPLADGRTLLATGSEDGTVWLWDPTTATPVGQPLSGHTGPVRAVAALPLADGRTLLATGSEDGTVWLWDPTTATPVGQPLSGHTGPLRAVAALPLADDHTLLATGSGDGTVRMWDPTTATLVGQPMAGHTGSVRAVAALPLADRHTLLATAGSDGTVRLWDPSTSMPVGHPMAGRSAPVLAVVALTLPDGRTLLATAGSDGTVRLWDPTVTWRNGPLWSRPVGRPLSGHTGRVQTVAALPLAGGRILLASGGQDGTIRLWDPTTATRRSGLFWSRPVGQTLSGHTGPVWAVAALPLPGGRILLASGGQDGTVRLWDPTTAPTAAERPSGHTGPVWAVAAAPLPDGRTLLATAGDDKTVRLWDPATATLAGRPLRGHTGSVWAVAALSFPGGRTLLATAGDDGTVRLWDPRLRRSQWRRSAGRLLTREHSDWIWAVAGLPLPNGRTLLAAAGLDGTVRLWDPRWRGLRWSRPVGRPLRGHTDLVRAVGALPLPDGRTLLASGGDDNKVMLWDPIPATRALQKWWQRPIGQPLSGHTGRVRVVVALPLPDGRTLLASASDDRTVRLWDPSTAIPSSRPLSGHTGRVRAVQVLPLPDGRTLLATADGEDGTVQLWDPTTATLVTVLNVSVPVLAIVSLPGGHLALGTTEGVAVLRVQRLSCGER